jgi:hypothetical protein
MHIDNHSYLTNRPLGQSEEASGTTDTAKRTGSAGAAPRAVSSHVRSPELLEMLARVKHAPEVRPEVLQRAAQRLASGYYLSRQAAEETASAILDSGD